MLLLALAYGLAGFGYIITATFLPVIAREAMPGSVWIDFFWPIFGLGVITGALLATRIPATGDYRNLLAACYLVQALGIAASVFSPNLAGFAMGSLLLGIPFTAITFFAMQEVRRLRPAAAASYMGLLTVMYGIGQIAGPPMVALLLRNSRSLGAGFTLSLEIAAATLVAGALQRSEGRQHGRAEARFGHGAGASLAHRHEVDGDLRIALAQQGTQRCRRGRLVGRGGYDHGRRLGTEGTLTEREVQLGTRLLVETAQPHVGDHPDHLGDVVVVQVHADLTDDLAERVLAGPGLARQGLVHDHRVTRT
jgi:hypothetical protein